jgi:hypothetical protein
MGMSRIEIWQVRVSRQQREMMMYKVFKAGIDTGRAYKTFKAANRAVHRMDAEYGASVHSYRFVEAK